jgi:UDP:flavonoid glycosyltransferase YjiC (YdhE family)
MSRIVSTAYGPSGDLIPFSHLAWAYARGHDVLFAVEESFRAGIMKAGFATYYLTGAIETALALSRRQMFGTLTPFASVRTIVDRYMLPTLRSKVVELLDACVGADLLVAAAGQLSASFIAELTGIPWVTLALTPGTIPSASLEPQPLPTMVQTLVNRVAWAPGAFVLQLIADMPVNHARRLATLRAHDRLLRHGSAGAAGRVPALVVSWGADQYLNAGQVAYLGAGRWPFYNHRESGAWSRRVAPPGVVSGEGSGDRHSDRAGGWVRDSVRRARSRVVTRDIHAQTRCTRPVTRCRPP